MRFADLDEICRIAKAHNLVVIEDCAHAHGGKWRRKGAGATGDMGCFSFQSSKLMTSGEGGGIITSNLEYYERAQSYTNCGRASATDQYQHRLIGFNYRITELQAAILAAQLDRLPKQAKIRQANMDHFEKRLRGTPGLAFLSATSARRARRLTNSSSSTSPSTSGVFPARPFLGALQMEGIPCDGLFYEPVYKSALFPLEPAIGRRSVGAARSPSI